MSLAENDSRFLEQLAAAFERSLAPYGAIVKSPDRLLDQDTNRQREVDVSIRYPVGSVPVLITVECRDRGRVEDCLWIEQLAAKKTAIGAHATIAVSTSGFGVPAQEKARICGIELRQVASIQDEDVARWFRGVFVTIGYLTYRVVSVGIMWPGNDLPAGIPAATQFEVADAWASPMFYESTERREIAIEDLFHGNWHVVEARGLRIGEKILKPIYFTPPEEATLYWPLRGRRRHVVKEVEVTVEIQQFCETITLDETLRQYAHGDTVLSYSGQGRVTTGLDQPIDIVVLKRSGAEAISVMFRQARKTQK